MRASSGRDRSRPDGDRGSRRPAPDIRAPQRQAALGHRSLPGIGRTSSLCSSLDKGEGAVVAPRPRGLAISDAPPMEQVSASRGIPRAPAAGGSAMLLTAPTNRLAASSKPLRDARSAVGITGRPGSSRLAVTVRPTYRPRTRSRSLPRLFAVRAAAAGRDAADAGGTPRVAASAPFSITNMPQPM